MSGRVERRLAAVLAADVAGYSRLMGADELGTLAALKACRRAIVHPAIARHNGRIVKTTGDGVLVEFGSAVDAVTCAIAVQARMAERNRAEEPQIVFRIGINVGDIILDGGDIFGDGVNVAARVENECEPGGVYLSDDAFRQVRSKTRFVFEDVGERTLKNIERPVRVYAVRLPVAVPEHPSAAAQSSNRVLGNAISDRNEPPALPEKPSIAVLPFQNMSGDSEQEYFADGIVEDIITALSHFKSLFVIARNSSFTYKGKSVDIKQVGRELGVRYVLEGSVRKAGNRVRITGQLIEAATNHHLWADKFDGAAEDIFSLQDQVTAAVVGLIAPAVEQAEIERAKRKSTDRLDSYDLYLRGLAISRRRSSFFEARGCFLRAIEQDPDYGVAYATAAWTYMVEQATGGLPLSDEKRSEAIRLANTAASLAPDDAFALARAGHVLSYIGRHYDRGLSMTGEAVALNPNLASAWYSQGWVALMCDEPERAIDSFDRMMRLSPLDPLRGSAWNGRSFALFSLGRYVEGCESAASAIQFFTDAHTLGAVIMNSICADRVDDAREAAARLLKLRPDFRASHSQQAFPVRSATIRDRIQKALEAAGVPA